MLVSVKGRGPCRFAMSSRRGGGDAGGTGSLMATTSHRGEQGRMIPTAVTWRQLRASQIRVGSWQQRVDVGQQHFHENKAEGQQTYNICLNLF